ncbi:DUF4062 domain-containing protein [Flavobacterium sp. GSB-24]|uniref:DUF4062 domain-containing protein n=1 Tax=Flavobacterium sp. GSB-24 TaxID=2994319 RepID=UPI00248F53F9|nr:DUF4062 domain-containing protein [Flavobacterium sp. GSB-24]BDU25283.1 hypothetical protein FLGSB24_20270 [Flavobacterium sp. GSB-24]
MAKQITKYSIFLASPSDLEEERFAVEEVVSELNLTYSPANNIVIELLKWETHSAPGISNFHPQKIITEDIGNDYDLFLGMIWKKFGTRTDESGSGTQEEFNNAIKKYNTDNNSVQILFYFKNAVPKTINEIDPEELIKIREFKKSLQEQKLLYSEFNSVDDFKNYLRIHIPKRLNSIIEKQRNGTTEIVHVITNNSIDDDLGILDYEEMFSSSINDSNLALARITEYTQSVGSEIEEKANQLIKITQSPHPNKVTINEIMKRTAKILNDYSNRLETETPIYYNSFEDAIKAGTNIINLSDEFYTKNTLTDLEEAKKNILILRKNTPLAIVGMTNFYESIKSLPRIQVDINQAKKILMFQMEDLILKLEKSLELTNDFSDAISSKIDKFKLIDETSDQQNH